jgi:iron complex outermembrane recepter protein
MRSNASWRVPLWLGIAMGGAMISAPIVSIASEPTAKDNQTQNTPSIQFDIGPQSLSSALNALALQSRQQILFTPEVAEGKTTPGVQGNLTADAALARLLAGTGLSSSRSSEGMILVNRVDVKEASPPTGPQKAPNGAPNDQSQISNPRTIEEIVVTAQKRAENLQDVPVPVTAINAETLVAQNQLRIQDYYASVPGLQYAPAAYSTQGLSIRGITTTSFGNPVVGVAIDGVPFGSSTQWGSGETLPDFDPGDLARIEVLRGPQGTLFGVDSIGGLINFVTAEPSADRTFGSVQAGMNNVENGDGQGYDARVSVNVPLGTSAAVRASGFIRNDPGYIDNPLYRIVGVNKDNVYGGMISTLWQISDALKVKFIALDQRDSGNGSSEVVLSGGQPILQQTYLPGVGSYVSEAQAYIATLEAKFGDIELTALSGYNVNTQDSSSDFTYFLGSLTQSLYGVTGSPIDFDLKNTKYSQEIRLTGPLGANLDWLVGGFGTHERARYLQNFFAQDPVTGTVITSDELTYVDTTYNEYAGFADLTLHINDRFDIQVGGRGAHIDQSFSQYYDGSLTPAFTGADSQVLVAPLEHASANAITYLLTPRFKISPDLMVYGRFTSGYQAGGPNVVLAGVPAQYDPDTTWNYEIGIKGQTDSRLFSYDVSLYHIDWRSIQLTLLTPAGTSYVANGARARSQGLEVSVAARPLSSLTVAGWLSWDDAKLTEDLPPASVAAGIFAVAGDRLPYSARLTGHLSLEQRFALTQGTNVFVGGAATYTGARFGEFTDSEADRAVYPAYTKVDFTAGVKHDSWALRCFVNNATNSRGELSGGAGGALPFAYRILKPRMIGFDITKEF